MADHIELTGQTVGELTVLRYAGYRKWVCQCSCGREVEKHGAALREGRTSVCSATFHAKRDLQLHPAEYRAWQWAKRRGIVEEWHVFRVFFDAVGAKPSDSAVLRRLNESELLGPQNYEWAPYRNAPPTS